MKSEQNLKSFLSGALEAYNRTSDEISISSGQDDDPVVSVYPVQTSTSLVYKWKLLCQANIEIDCEATDESLDAGEAREKGWIFIDKYRESIRLAILKKKREISERETNGPK